VGRRHRPSIEKQSGTACPSFHQRQLSTAHKGQKRLKAAADVSVSSLTPDAASLVTALPATILRITFFQDLIDVE
jgi:hypothetical protein